jgi:hypothetical protein
MSQEFEHIVILLGFIFGLALTHLLTSINDLIHARCRVRFSWLHALSMVLALVFFIINWLALWDMRRVPHWRVLDVLSLLLSTANQYLVCSLVAMRVPEEGDVDMAAFAERQTTPFLISVAALHVMAMLGNYQFRNAYPEAAPWWEQNLVILPMFLLTLAAICLKRRWLTMAAVSLQILVFSAFTALFTLQG